MDLDVSHLFPTFFLRSSNTSRRCIAVKEKPPPPTEVIPTKRSIVTPPTFMNGSSVFFEFEVNVSYCLYWDEEREVWSTEGCRVGCSSCVSPIAIL